MTGGAPVRVVVALALAATVAAGSCNERDDRLGGIGELTRSEHFDNGREAAGALATIGELAIDQQAECLEAAGETSRHCEAFGVLAAWAQVSAIEVARCGRAGAEETRRSLAELVDGVDSLRRGERDDVPAVPPTPSCP